MSGSVATALGASLGIEWRGKKILLGSLKWGSVICELENWLVERAIKFKTIGWKAQVDSGLMTREESQSRSEAFIDECVESGKYSFGGDVMNTILKTAEAGQAGEVKKTSAHFGAILKLGSLLTGLNEDEVVELMSEKREELSLALSVAMRRSLPSPEDVAAEVQQPMMTAAG